MRLDELLKGAPAEQILAPADLDITEICFDSRKCGPGKAYAAVPRPATDGHAYIPAAVEAGASLIVAREPVEGVHCVVAEDTAAVMACMAANLYGRPADSMKMIGITGTKGKTSTAFFVKQLLEETLHAKVGLLGTICNMAGDEVLSQAHNTTPEAPELHEMLAQMRDKGCTHVVMEVSSHSLALGRVSGIRFAAGVFTNLSQDHLDFHGTMENYLAAKAKLFAQCGRAVINRDDPAGASLLPGLPCPVDTIGRTDADIMLEDIDLHATDGVRFTMRIGTKSCPVEVHTPGMFTVYNAAAAIAAVHALGAKIEKCAAAMGTFGGVPGRVEPVAIGRDFRVIVDYAHSPDSVEQVSRTAREFTKGRLISVLGCGGNRDRTKRPLMAAAAARYGDIVILTTDNPRFEEPEAIIDEMIPGLDGASVRWEKVVDRREAIFRALDLAEKDDTVLIMGKGHENYVEIRGVRTHFDDREPVREWAEKH